MTAMSALTSPRGPLPARVYWFRRLLVLGVALVLVVGLARVLGGGSDGDDPPEAAQVGSDGGQNEDADPSATPTDEPTATPDDSGPTRSTGPAEATTAPPAEPEGECEPGDVVVEPSVWRPVEGIRVLIGLDVSTEDAAACYWDVSDETLTMKITSGDDDIWSTRQCPDAVPERQVVVRSDSTTKIVVPWSGRRSDDECSDATDPALPGYYFVEAAALAGEPSDVQFQLRAPAPPEITRSPSPNGNGGNGNGGGSGPSASPSGAVEPDQP